MSEEPLIENEQETWSEVGRQFQALGDSLARALRTTWESEENRQAMRSLQSDLEAMANHVGRAIDDAIASPEGQHARQEVERAAESACLAGKQALQESRPHLLSALRQVNDELQKLAQRLETPQE